MVYHYTDPGFRNPNGRGDTDIIIYGYTPSLSLAVIGAVVFGIYGLVAIGLLVRPRRAGAILTFIGTAFEVVGYACRCLSAKVDPYFLAYFVCQYFFIVVAPVFFAATIYIGLSRLLIGVTGPDEKPPVAPRPILIIFVTFDIITTIIQVAGAAAIGTAESNGQDPGPSNNAVIAGLAVQTAAFLVFIIIFLVAMGRLVSRSKQTSGPSASAFKDSQWLFGLLLVTAILVQLRTAFRLAESAQGVGGDLSGNETYFGCLEFLPLVLAVLGLLTLEWAFKRPWGAFANVSLPQRRLMHPTGQGDLEAAAAGVEMPAVDKHAVSSAANTLR